MVQHGPRLSKMVQICSNSHPQALAKREECTKGGDSRCFKKGGRAPGAMDKLTVIDDHGEGRNKHGLDSILDKLQGRSCPSSAHLVTLLVMDDD